MADVEIEMTIDAPMERVWEAMVDVSSFPKFMNAVKDIEVLEETEVSRVTAWSVVLKGSVLKWTERDEIDAQARTVTFTQVDGDLERFEGTWRAFDRDDGVRLVLQAKFEIGIPLLTDMLTPVATDALRESHEDILSNIERQVTS